MANAVSLINPLNDLWKNDKVALGILVRMVRSGDIAGIAKTSGHDFIFIDAQHAIYSIETLTQMAQVAIGCGIVPLARVSSCDDPNTSVLLDNGMAGIVFPDINTAAEAQRAVNRVKFAPLGARSVSGNYTMFNFAAVPTGEASPVLNKYGLAICMIETMEGVDNIEEIAAIEGVDVIHVGSSDLLNSMGKPGAYGSPEHIAAVDRVIAVAKAHGKIPGLGGDRDPSRQAEFIRKGVRFVTTQSDIALMMAEATKVAGNLRKAIVK